MDKQLDEEARRIHYLNEDGTHDDCFFSACKHLDCVYRREQEQKRDHGPCQPMLD